MSSVYNIIVYDIMYIIYIYIYIYIISSAADVFHFEHRTYYIPKLYIGHRYI
jgi:hypothetical protein